MFRPRTAQEMLRELIAVTISQTPLTDISGTDPITQLLGATAEGMAGVEFRMRRIADAFTFEGAVGAELDARALELPTPIRRLPAAPASGASVKFIRSTTAGDLVIPAGATVTRSDNRSLVYVTTSAVTIPAGSDSVANVRVVCQVPGVIGNAPVGTVDTLGSVPDTVISVVQELYIGGGSDQESDDELKARMRAHMAGLTGSTPWAIKALALSFVSSAGVRARYAYLTEDVAYAELVVDDGSAFAGNTQPGAQVSGTVPPSGTLVLFHHGPAVAPITKIKVNGTTLSYPDPDTNPTWVSYPERGIVQLKAGQTDISPGDTWVIGDAATPYSVYTGFIAELQRTIEGSWTPDVPGYRPMGSRLVVRPPTTYSVDVTVNLLLETGANVDDAVTLVRALTDEFFDALGPGEPMYISKLYAALSTAETLSSGIKAVQLLNPTTDVHPSDPTVSLRLGNFLGV